MICTEQTQSSMAGMLALDHTVYLPHSILYVDHKAICVHTTGFYFSITIWFTNIAV